MVVLAGGGQERGGDADAGCREHGTAVARPERRGDGRGPDRLARAGKEIGRAPLWLSAHASPTVRQQAAEARRLHEGRGGLRLPAADGLHELSAPDGPDRGDESVRGTVRDLRRPARGPQITVAATLLSAPPSERGLRT